MTTPKTNATDGLTWDQVDTSSDSVEISTQEFIWGRIQGLIHWIEGESDPTVRTEVQDEVDRLRRMLRYA